MRKNIRRKYLLHPSIQFKYMLTVSVPLLIIGIVSIWLIDNMSTYILQRDREYLLNQLNVLEKGAQEIEKYTKKLPELNALRSNFLNIKNSYRHSVLINLSYLKKFKELFIFHILVLIAGGLFISLIFSHRVVGPIYRLRQYIELLSRGEQIPQVKLRRYDEFKEVASSLDRLRESLEFRKENIRKIIERLEEELKNIKSKPDVLLEDIENIEKNIAELKKVV